MLGAIIGDIIGSTYEWHNVKTTKFDLFTNNSSFTDDTVLSVAVADAIPNKQKLKNPIIDEIKSRQTYAYKLREYGRKYPNAGYGEMFISWLSDPELKPYHSYGNGSAMRVSPIGFAYDSLEEVLKEAKRSAVVTHNHTVRFIGETLIYAVVVEIGIRTGPKIPR